LAALLCTWISLCPTDVYLTYHVQAVARAAERRRLLSSALDVADAARDVTLDADAAYHRAGEVVAATRRPLSQGGQDLDPRGRALLLGELLARRRAREEPGLVRTGFYDVDRELGGGLRPGQLALIGGRPGAG